MADNKEKLAEARSKIDEIDEEIAELFNKRQQLSSEIAQLKKAENLPTLDLAREEIVMKRAEEKCGVYGRELFRLLMDLSKKEQAKYR